jgi:hypothetical protein
MSTELQSEAIDLIVSQLDKQRGNYEVTRDPFVDKHRHSSHHHTLPLISYHD